MLYMARDQGFSLHALSFDYQQRHRIELDRAARLAEHCNAKHTTVRIDLGVFSGSALTDPAIPVPRTHGRGEGIPITYVPARNILFLSYGLALAESNGVHDVFLGVNATDYSGYPDCRPEFIQAYENMANLGLKSAVERQPMRIHAPLMHMTKASIIRAGTALGVDYGLTSSCYDPDSTGRPCGQCDSCGLRARGFAEAGLIDPLRSENN